MSDPAPAPSGMISRLVVFASFCFMVGAMLGPAERPVASILVALGMAPIGARAYRKGRKRIGSLFIAGAALLAGFVASAWRLPREDTLSALVRADSRPFVLEGVVAEAPELGLEADALIVDVDRVATTTIATFEAASARVRLRIPHPSPEDCAASAVPVHPAPVALAGDRVRIVASLHALHPTSMPLLRSRRLALRRAVAVAGEATSRDACTILEPASSRSALARVMAPFASLRDAAAAAIARDAPPASAGVLRALGTGDRTGLAFSDEERFLRAGLSHLFSLGALYASAIAFAAFTGLQRLLRDRRRAGLAAVPIALFAALCFGATPTMLRMALVLVAVLASPTETWIAISLAVVLCLAIDPGALGDLAFQVPFAAFAAVIRTYPALAELVPAKLRPGRVVAFGLAVAIGIAPLAARMFDRVTVASLVANAIAVPLSATIIAPLALLGGLAGTISDTLGSGILALASLLLAPLDALTSALAANRAFAIPAPTMLECILFCGATISFSLPDRPPDDTSPRPKWITPKRAGVLLSAALLAAIAIGTIATRSHHTIRAAFLPVAKGHAALIELPNGEAIGFSTAPPAAGYDLGERALANYAKLRRHAKLRAIYVAANDPAHREAARDLSHQLDVEEIWWNAGASDVTDIDRARFDPAAKHKYLRDEPSFEAGGAQIRAGATKLGVGELEIDENGGAVLGDQAIDTKAPNALRTAEDGLIIAELGETFSVTPFRERR